MPEVHYVEICDAPLAVAFDYLDDYRNVTDYWHGMTSYTPVGTLDHGLGSVFAAVSKIGPATLKSTIEAVHWERDVRIAYKSISGMDSATTFDFSAIDATRCRVEFRVEFHLPGGIAGKALAKTVEPYVSATARTTAQNMAREIAAHYATISADPTRGTTDTPK
ncbi:MAG: SRPBCC family protein [Actinomycetota bacterium]|nr:SRPBCC family protein [Actinomycetota bacterium]